MGPTLPLHEQNERYYKNKIRKKQQQIPSNEDSQHSTPSANLANGVVSFQTYEIPIRDGSSSALDPSPNNHNLPNNNSNINSNDTNYNDAATPKVSLRRHLSRSNSRSRSPTPFSTMPLRMDFMASAIASHRSSRSFSELGRYIDDDDDDEVLGKRNVSHHSHHDIRPSKSFASFIANRRASKDDLSLVPRRSGVLEAQSSIMSRSLHNLFNPSGSEQRSDSQLVSSSSTDRTPPSSSAATGCVDDRKHSPLRMKKEVRVQIKSELHPDVNDLSSNKEETPPVSSSSDPATIPALKQKKLSRSESSIFRTELSKRQVLDNISTMQTHEASHKANAIASREWATFLTFLIIVYLIIGCLYFQMHAQTEWSILDSLLFGVYTFTTVGYGTKDIPRDDATYAFLIVFASVGIGIWHIALLQFKDFLRTERARLESSRTKRYEQQQRIRAEASADIDGDIMTRSSLRDTIRHYYIVDQMIRVYEWSIDRVKDGGASGRLYSIFLPFFTMAFPGAAIMYFLESSWSVGDSIYWAIVSLSTIGYGDLVPTNLYSKWFCILYLMFSTAFLSIFLSNVILFYTINMFQKNSNRLSLKMHSKMIKELEMRFGSRFDSNNHDDCDNHFVINTRHNHDVYDIEAATAPAQDNGHKEDTSSPNKVSSPFPCPSNFIRRPSSLMHANVSMRQIMSHYHGGNDLAMPFWNTASLDQLNSSSGILDLQVEHRIGYIICIDVVHRCRGMYKIMRNTDDDINANSNTNLLDETLSVGCVGVSSASVAGSSHLPHRSSNFSDRGSTSTHLRASDMNKSSCNTSAYSSHSILLREFKEVMKQWSISRASKSAFQQVVMRCLFQFGDAMLKYEDGGFDMLLDLPAMEYREIMAPFVLSLDDESYVSPSRKEIWLATTTLVLRQPSNRNIQKRRSAMLNSKRSLAENASHDHPASRVVADPNMGRIMLTQRRGRSQSISYFTSTEEVNTNQDPKIRALSSTSLFSDPGFTSPERHEKDLGIVDEGEMNEGADSVMSVNVSCSTLEEG